MFRFIYRRLCIRLKGLPVMYIIYKPWQKGKNVILHSCFMADDYIDVRCKEIAEHIRDQYQSDMDKFLNEVLEREEIE